MKIKVARKDKFMQTNPMGTRQYELTESKWNRIKDMLPPEHPKQGKRGRPAKCDNRRAMNGYCGLSKERHRGEAVWRMANSIFI